MIPSISFSDNILPDISVVYLLKDKILPSQCRLSKTESKFLKEKLAEDKKAIEINSYSRWNFFRVFETDKLKWQTKEDIRRSGSKLQNFLQEQGETAVQIVDFTANEDFQLAFAEGLILSNYKFDKYLTDKKKKKEALKKIIIISAKPNKKKWEQFIHQALGVYESRNLINEPLLWLNAEKLASECERLGTESGFRVKVFDKKKIIQLEMGGLLAVNKGSVDPPVFIVMEWKPKRFINENPLVLVGKGIVYDTGGLSLKPTLDSMDYMKCDMSGAAAVAGAMYAAAKSKLPVHLVGLIPATDNRPSGNAYAPGDIITMMNKTTVEMLNADAEGRMILADALCYAKKYKPMLVIDIATLTGSAIAATGKVASVAFSKNADEMYSLLDTSGNETYERLVQFPLWDDYSEMIESKIADVKNVGGKYAGVITAAKFLEKFTDYPWIHLDIAGTAFTNTKDSYRGLGGTAVGVRLFYDFFNRIIRK
ncbi:MAG: peptidase M17 [Bacteroidetes bacterium CG23_combo_of_CG06-09_8_20_14_all_32_9]|nr:MAG: peptidase M17 [Bacteroidetes bacterium CG23_combo_of_CG06-09_8_20_14_all_32_9]